MTTVLCAKILITASVLAGVFWILGSTADDRGEYYQADNLFSAARWSCGVALISFLWGLWSL